MSRRALLRLRLRGRGLWQLHAAAGVLRRARPGLRAADRLELHRHARPRREGDLRGRGEETAEGQAPLGGPLRRPGLKGERWYAWAWIAAGSPRPHQLVRRHLKTGELAFHYCYVPEGQLLAKTRLIRAAGLRCPVRRTSGPGRTALGLDQCCARLYTAIQRHIVLVMTALAICAITAALVRDCAGAQAPPPMAPGHAPSPDPGMIPITVPEVKRLLSAAVTPRKPRGHAARWLAWRRRHQARARWFHQRTRLSREYTLVS